MHTLRRIGCARSPVILMVDTWALSSGVKHLLVVIGLSRLLCVHCRHHQDLCRITLAPILIVSSRSTSTYASSRRLSFPPTSSLRRKQNKLVHTHKNPTKPSHLSFVNSLDVQGPAPAPAPAVAVPLLCRSSSTPESGHLSSFFAHVDDETIRLNLVRRALRILPDELVFGPLIPLEASHDP